MSSSTGTSGDLLLDYDTQQIKDMDTDFVMHIYSRQQVLFTRGEGVYLWDSQGKRYLDFVGGIAVNGLGHCHPAVVAAIRHQAGQLMHTSNLYYTAPQARLAKKLCEISGFERVFFCNSGAEANEAAVKLVKKFGKQIDPAKFHIVSMQGSFHGRTTGALSATAQPKYREAFEPLIPGFSYVPLNDCNALESAVTDSTCAIIIEPIQGESGVFPATAKFLQKARELCDRHNALLIFDEVQCGMGRTGEWWAHEVSGAIPDVMTSAKALGSGFPVGACLARGEAAGVLVPGDHGSTYAGNPLAASAALATIKTIERDDLRTNAREVGGYLIGRLLSAEFAPYVSGVRGSGFMVGIQLSLPQAKSVATAAMERGLIVNAVGDEILRLLPPLITTAGQVDQALEILHEVFAQ